MNQPPPPLPNDTNTFAHQAAKFCLWAPLIGIVINVALNASQQGNTGSGTAMARLVVACVSLGLMLLGLVFGVVALVGMRSHGREGILGKAIAGIILNLSLLGLVGVGFVQGFKQARERAKGRQSLEQVHRSAQEFQAEVKRNFEKEGTISPDMKQMDKLIDSLDKASKESSGPEAAVAKATTAYLGHLQRSSLDYQDVLNRMKEAPVLDVSKVTQKEELQTKRGMVKDFMVANEKLAKTISMSESIFETELSKAGVPTKFVTATMDGFRQKARPRNALMLKIRDTDKQLGEGMIGLLDLLETNWGQWRFDQKANLIQFQKDAVGDQYNTFLEKLDTVSQEQSNLQRALVNLK